MRDVARSATSFCPSARREPDLVRIDRPRDRDRPQRPSDQTRSLTAGRGPVHLCRASPRRRADPGLQRGPADRAVVRGALEHLPVIVVDDGSADDTAARAARRRRDGHRTAPEPGQGRGAPGRLPPRTRRGRRRRPDARRRRPARPGRDPVVPRRVRGGPAARPRHRPPRLPGDAADPPPRRTSSAARRSRGPSAARSPTTSRATG